MSILNQLEETYQVGASENIFPVLYKYTSKGQPQQWQIFVNGDAFYTEEGIVGGVITKSKPTTCLPKNPGKKNETTGADQALKEAKAKHQKKLDTHYNEVLTEERSFYEPMLAHKYEDHLNLLFTVPTFISGKLDGLRCINQNNSQQSRGGKQYLASPHLNQSDVVLDGELYNHIYKSDFNSLVSLFKKQKPTEEDLLKSLEFGEYHVYDMPEVEGVFSIRYAALKTWIETQSNTKIKLVEAIQVFNESELEAQHIKNLEDGYEGSIIRLDLNSYEGKRSKQLLKYKLWFDDEFEIVGFEEGKGLKVGMVGAVVLKMKGGQLCNSNMDGTHEFSKYVWEHQNEYIGKMATVKYQGITPDGKLRIPYVKDLDRNEYETI